MKEESENRWHKFWNKQESALHATNSRVFASVYNGELQLLLKRFCIEACQVVELGCGDGALFEAIGLSKAKSYLGIDFSSSLLSIFRSRFPGVELMESNIANLQPGFRENTDVVFANGVVQYLSKHELKNLITLACSILKPGGAVVLSSVPWDSLKSDYYSGVFFDCLRPWYMQKLTRLVAGLRGSMGDWYSPSTILLLAQEAKMSCDILGSLSYPYRFHVILTRIQK